MLKQTSVANRRLVSLVSLYAIWMYQQWLVNGDGIFLHVGGLYFVHSVNVRASSLLWGCLVWYESVDGSGSLVLELQSTRLDISRLLLLMKKHIIDLLVAFLWILFFCNGRTLLFMTWQLTWGKYYFCQGSFLGGKPVFLTSGKCLPILVQILVDVWRQQACCWWALHFGTFDTLILRKTLSTPGHQHSGQGYV